MNSSHYHHEMETMFFSLEAVPELIFLTMMVRYHFNFNYVLTTTSTVVSISIDIKGDNQHLG